MARFDDTVQPWQEAAIRIAIDLQLFKHVVDAGEAGIDAEALAQKTRAEARLIGEANQQDSLYFSDDLSTVRLQRVLVALGLGVAGPDGRYRASSKTAILTQAQGIDAFKFWFVQIIAACFRPYVLTLE